jgi:hydrogenase expression/formation protein HypD
MRYVDEFRDPKKIIKIAQAIKKLMPGRDINIMEVCGTHTQNFYRFGLDKVLPSRLRLIAGPGCPVCVSAQSYIDSAIKLARLRDVVILSFGDMLRVPGTSSTLEKERARTGNIRVVYSPLECLTVARLNPRKKIVFLAVGFETTASAIAMTLALARKERLKNLFFLPSLKLIPAAMAHLLKDERMKLDGFLCPGHVSVIIGTHPYEFIVRKYGIGCCVAGFEPADILEGVFRLLRQIVTGRPRVANQYIRAVKPSGNIKAMRMIRRVFKATDATWRGLGAIPASGLSIRKEFQFFDAQREFCLQREKERTRQRETKCRCADVLKGMISAKECPLFSKGCTPDHPAGPCMVTNEGACHAYYRYRSVQSP